MAVVWVRGSAARSPARRRRGATPRRSRRSAGTTTSRRRSCSARKSSTAVRTPLRAPPSRAAGWGREDGGRARPGPGEDALGSSWNRLARSRAGPARGRSSRRDARVASTRRGTAAAAAAAPGGPLGDEPQLAADREPVVVAVHDRPRRAARWSGGPRGWWRGQARDRRDRRASATSSFCGAGSIAQHRGAGRLRPLQQHARQIARVRADLRHRRRARSLQTATRSSAAFGPRGTPASGVVGEWFDLELDSAPCGARQSIGA